MNENHEQSNGRRQFEDPELITKTMMGDFITPNELMGRIASVLVSHPDGLNPEDLLDAVRAVTPEVTDHAELEITASLIESCLDSLRGFGLDIYTDEQGKIRYFAPELDI